MNRFFKKRSFDVDHFKIFIEFVTTLLPFYVFWVFFFFLAPEACRILAS